MSVTCQCKTSMLIQPNDGSGTIMCPQCGRMWHMCKQHRQVAVKGPGLPMGQNMCTCQSDRQLKRHCPRCNSRNIQEMQSGNTSLICHDCNTVFHMCLQHQKPVLGPGYAKQSIDLYRCSCAVSGDTFAKWQSAFL